MKLAATTTFARLAGYLSRPTPSPEATIEQLLEDAIWNGTLELADALPRLIEAARRIVERDGAASARRLETVCLYFANNLQGPHGPLIIQGIEENLDVFPGPCGEFLAASVAQLAKGEVDADRRLELIQIAVALAERSGVDDKVFAHAKIALACVPVGTSEELFQIAERHVLMLLEAAKGTPQKTLHLHSRPAAGRLDELCEAVGQAAPSELGSRLLIVANEAAECAHEAIAAIEALPPQPRLAELQARSPGSSPMWRWG